MIAERDHKEFGDCHICSP